MAPDYIDHHLWEAISRRLILPCFGIAFPLQQPGSLDALISYLTRKQGGNVHDEGIVTVTSKLVFMDINSLFGMRYAVDFSSQYYFSSKSEPNQWICWDFHEKRVVLTHYTIINTVKYR
jgi:hypothetical protein